MYTRISAGDLAGFGALMADGFVEHEAQPGMPPTKEGVLELFRMLRIAFPDMLMEPQDVLADGDKGIARVRVTGTHRGDFFGIPATGKPVDMQVIDIMRFDAAGLTCEHWGVTDMLTLMQQIGVVPTELPA